MLEHIANSIGFNQVDAKVMIGLGDRLLLKLQPDNTWYAIGPAHKRVD